VFEAILLKLWPGAHSLTNNSISRINQSKYGPKDAGQSKMEIYFKYPAGFVGKVLLTKEFVCLRIKAKHKNPG
jgi:hypothetical protein